MPRHSSSTALYPALFVLCLSAVVCVLLYIMRIVVTAWYLFSTLFGSGLCCCTLHGRSLGADPTKAASVPAAPKPCCGCNSDGFTPTQPAKPAQAPLGKSCPCRDVGRFQDALKASKTLADESQSVRSLEGVVLSGSRPQSCLATLSVSSPDQTAVLPFDTAAHLLHVFHILRC